MASTASEREVRAHSPACTRPGTASARTTTAGSRRSKPPTDTSKRLRSTPNLPRDAYGDLLRVASSRGRFHRPTARARRQSPIRVPVDEIRQCLGVRTRCSVCSCGSYPGIVPSVLRTRNRPAMPMSEWLWTWQWYIHAPAPTSSPAITWKPKESAGPHDLVVDDLARVVGAGEHARAVVRPAVTVHVEGVVVLAVRDHHELDPIAHRGLEVRASMGGLVVDRHVVEDDRVGRCRAGRRPCGGRSPARRGPCGCRRCRVPCRRRGRGSASSPRCPPARCRPRGGPGRGCARCRCGCRPVRRRSGSAGCRRWRSRSPGRGRAGSRPTSMVFSNSMCRVSPSLSSISGPGIDALPFSRP